jgi:large subunit ribosomal protein L21
MKYAIVESGGKQYQAVEGATIEVDLLPFEEGQEIKLDSVMLYVEDENVCIGTPYVQGASVTATVMAESKGPKVVVFRYRPKKRYRVKTGHRQQYTQLKIASIRME